MTETIEYKPLERKFIELLRTGEHKDPLALVKLRLHKLKLSEVCWRCGGSGYYAKYGVCFRCNGLGYENYRLTKALYEETEKAVADGKLDEYIEELRRKQKLKTAKDELFRLSQDNALADDYSAFYTADRFGKSLQVMFKLRNEQTSKYKEYEQLQYKLESKAHKTKWKELLGDEFNEEDFKKINEEALCEKYDEVRAALIKINEEYDAFKGMFLTLFR